MGWTRKKILATSRHDRALTNLAFVPATVCKHPDVALIEAARVAGALPDLKRVVVAIDPSSTSGDDAGDSIGIVVAGIGGDGVGYLLADEASPAVWGARAVAAYHKFKADCIIAERNFGGAMVEHVIRTVDSAIPYRDVTASRGKIARAEPIAALYEQNKVRRAGNFSELEDQLCAMTGDGDGSPDRADALVWALRARQFFRSERQRRSHLRHSPATHEGHTVNRRRRPNDQLPHRGGRDLAVAARRHWASTGAELAPRLLLTG
jgi:phage terminase large subunit-like protein